LEELTRTQYRQWAQHGMQVVQRLAEERTGPPRWPGLDVDRPAVPDGVLTHRHLSTTPRSDGTSVREAYDNGWLVEVAEHAAEDGCGSPSKTISMLRVCACATARRAPPGACPQHRHMPGNNWSVTVPRVSARPPYTKWPGASSHRRSPTP